MREKLAATGMRQPVPLRDRTPDLHRRTESGLYTAVLRGEEVQRWIEDRGFTGRYVCLDDEDDFLSGQPLVQTNFAEGLTAEIADRCIRLLREPVEVGNDDRD